MKVCCDEYKLIQTRQLPTLQGSHLQLQLQEWLPVGSYKVQILLKKVFARGPTRALSGSYVVNWSLVLILDTANAQKKKLARVFIYS